MAASTHSLTGTPRYLDTPDLEWAGRRSSEHATVCDPWTDSFDFHPYLLCVPLSFSCRCGYRSIFLARIAREPSWHEKDNRGKRCHVPCNSQGMCIFLCVFYNASLSISARYGQSSLLCYAWPTPDKTLPTPKRAKKRHRWRKGCLRISSCHPRGRCPLYSEIEAPSSRQRNVCVHLDKRD